MPFNFAKLFTGSKSQEGVLAPKKKAAFHIATEEDPMPIRPYCTVDTYIPTHSCAAHDGTCVAQVGHTVFNAIAYEPAPFVFGFEATLPALAWEWYHTILKVGHCARMPLHLIPVLAVIERAHPSSMVYMAVRECLSAFIHADPIMVILFALHDTKNFGLAKIALRHITTQDHLFELYARTAHQHVTIQQLVCVLLYDAGMVEMEEYAWRIRAARREMSYNAILGSPFEYRNF